MSVSVQHPSGNSSSVSPADGQPLSTPSASRHTAPADVMTQHATYIGSQDLSAATVMKGGVEHSRADWPQTDLPPPVETHQSRRRAANKAYVKLLRCCMTLEDVAACWQAAVKGTMTREDVEPRGSIMYRRADTAGGSSRDSSNGHASPDMSEEQRPASTYANQPAEPQPSAPQTAPSTPIPLGAVDPRPTTPHPVSAEPCTAAPTPSAPHPASASAAHGPISFDPQSLTATLSRLHSLHKTSRPSPDSLPRLHNFLQAYWSPATLDALPEMDPSGLCIISRCLAQLEYQSDLNLLDAILVQTDITLLDFSPRAYAEVLWGLVRLQYRPPDAWVRRYLRAAVSRSHLLQPQDLSMLLYSAAKLSQAAARQAKLQHSLTNAWAAPSRDSNFDPDFVPSESSSSDDDSEQRRGAASVAMFPATESLRTSLSEILPPLLTAFEAQLHGYDIHSLCCSLWALSVLRFIPYPNALDQSLRRASSTMAACHPTSLAMLSYAFSVFVHPPGPAFCAALYSASQPALAHARAQDLALIAMGVANWTVWASPEPQIHGWRRPDGPDWTAAHNPCAPSVEWLEALCDASMPFLRHAHPDGSSSSSSSDGGRVHSIKESRHSNNRSSTSVSDGRNGSSSQTHQQRAPFTPQGLSLILAALARLNHRPPAAWMARVEATLEKILPPPNASAIGIHRVAMHPSAFSLILCALGRMEYRPSPYLATALAACLVEDAANIPAKRFSPALYALAILRIQPSPSQLLSLASSMQSKLEFCYPDQLLQPLEAWSIWGRGAIASQWAGNFMACLAPKLSSASPETVLRFWVLLPALGFRTSVAVVAGLLAASCEHAPAMSAAEVGESCAATVAMLCSGGVLQRPVKPHMAAWAEAMAGRCRTLESVRLRGGLSEQEEVALLRARRILDDPLDTC